MEGMVRMRFTGQRAIYQLSVGKMDMRNVDVRVPHMPGSEMGLMIWPR